MQSSHQLLLTFPVSQRHKQGHPDPSAPPQRTCASIVRKPQSVCAPHPTNCCCSSCWSPPAAAAGASCCCCLGGGGGYLRLVSFCCWGCWDVRLLVHPSGKILISPANFPQASKQAVTYRSNSSCATGSRILSVKKVSGSDSDSARPRAITLLSSSMSLKYACTCCCHPGSSCASGHTLGPCMTDALPSAPTSRWHGTTRHDTA